MIASIHDRLAAAGLPPLPRSVWLEIDVDALRSNLAVIRGLVGPAVEINAVVKADAYGHGLVPVARVFEQAGVARLCVASVDEAFVLRRAGLTVPVLVLFPIPQTAVGRAAREQVEVVASDVAAATALLDQWRRDAPTETRDVVLNVHLEVETGLSRNGVVPRVVVDLARLIEGTPRTRLAGIWSHLATSESESPTINQQRAFEEATTALRAARITLPPRHISATGGILTSWSPKYDGVRPGLSLYGLLPDELTSDATGLASSIALRPAMQLKCQALRIQTVPAGTAVGYGGTWVARRKSVIATLPVGYGDGFARAYALGAEVLVRGGRAPLVGTVAMDAVMVDVTDIPGVGPEDEWVVLGRQGSESITASDLARLRNTNPWEVVTTMSFRIPRVYHADSVLLGSRTLDGETLARAEADE